MQNSLAPLIAIARPGLPFTAGDGQAFVRLPGNTGGFLQTVVLCQTPKGVSQQLNKCVLTLADNGIELKFRHLHGKKRIIELRDEPGGASYQNNPPDAPPDFDPPPQPTEPEEVKAQ
jgi:hypothetical protein